MHYGGYACDMDAIMALAGKHGLAVIEDAAHAPGSSLDGRGLGTWGRAGVFSFFSNKNLATGEGACWSPTMRSSHGGRACWARMP